MTPLIPSGAGANAQAVLQSHNDAIADLQNPGAPTQFAAVALKATLPPAANWPNTAIICTEINALVCSTSVAGTWTWLRADGSAL